MNDNINEQEAAIRNKRESTAWTPDYRGPETALKCVMDALAEEILLVSDEDLMAEAAEQGLDPAQEAEEVRRILLAAVREVQKDKNPPPAVAATHR